MSLDRLRQWLRRAPVIDYRVDVPADWNVLSEPDSHGFQIIEPPSGDGRMGLTTVVPKASPPVTEDYALDQATRGFASMGLPTEAIELRRLGPDHFAVAVEGQAHGEHTLGVVHIFPGRTVIGWFHSDDPENPNNLAVSRILSSISAG